MDFTINQYIELLKSIQNARYEFQTMEEFLQKPLPKVFILRHDVDERPHNALKLAKAESSLGIKATYYFRIVKISNDPAIIRQIADLGHEIGYHYEDLATSNGNLEEAIDGFAKNLAYFREFYPVQTVCMHGSSMSDHDNRIMWQHYKLEDFGIIGEPYLSIDYSKVYYLTDTGRCWDGDKYSVRDFVGNKFPFSFHRSSEIIEALNANKLPDQVILQSHTLWTDSMKEWLWLVGREKIRNKMKIIIVKMPWLKKAAYKVIESYSK